MTIKHPLPRQAIVAQQPNVSASTHDWLNWFWTAFLPGWIERARDPEGFGFFDELNEHAQPAQQNRRSVLAQARLLFTFSHLALISSNDNFHAAAHVAREALPAFLKASGGYRRACTASGLATGNSEDEHAFSYDQSFVILGLVTWAKLNPRDNINAEIEACWSFIENQLTDSATGLLLEHDGLDDPAQPGAPQRAQNPHMHLFEAALQAYEMTDNPVWLERASQMRAKGLEFFFDHNTGTICEFLTPDLAPLAGRDGQRREVGHQCEWAWLLYREAELGGDNSQLTIANRLLSFADKHGFAPDGVVQGAAFDAVSCDASWQENQFLLWPQTEAIKTYAIRADQPGHAQRAQSLTLLMFKQYFSNHAAFVNQLDNTGKPIWPDALSRLLYHLVLALTEGARAGLWQKP